MKAALIVLDGLADRPQGALGGRTPLQAAATPNLDLLASAGACGQMYPVAPGICPSSEQAHWRMLGYGPHEFPGRASVEALGAGFNITGDEVAFRINLATTMVDEGERYVQIAPAYLPEEQAARVANSLAAYRGESFETRLLHIGGPFMVLVLSPGASAMVTDSDPLFYRMPIPRIVPLDGAGEAAARTAAELERFSSWASGVLADHPVNAGRDSEGQPAIDHVLVKWASTRPAAPGFSEEWGFRGVSVASGIFYGGLARLLGMEFHDIAEQDPGEDLYCKLRDAREALDGGFDFAFVHSKAADEASHTGRPARKVRTIEELDLAMTAVADSFAGDPEVFTIITCDHTSPSGGTDEVIHSGESVPVLALGRNVRVDSVCSFDEVCVAAGSLGTIRGDDIMPLVLDFTDRARFGLSRLHPSDRPYR